MQFNYVPAHVTRTPDSVDEIADFPRELTSAHIEYHPNLEDSEAQAILESLEGSKYVLMQGLVSGFTVRELVSATIDALFDAHRSGSDIEHRIQSVTLHGILRTEGSGNTFFLLFSLKDEDGKYLVPVRDSLGSVTGFVSNRRPMFVLHSASVEREEADEYSVEVSQGTPYLSFAAFAESARSGTGIVVEILQKIFVSELITELGWLGSENSASMSSLKIERWQMPGLSTQDAIFLVGNEAGTFEVPVSIRFDRDQFWVRISKLDDSEEPQFMR